MSWYHDIDIMTDIISFEGHNVFPDQSLGVIEALGRCQCVLFSCVVGVHVWYCPEWDILYACTVD